MREWRLTAGVLCLLVLLTGCADDDEPTVAEHLTTSPSRAASPNSSTATPTPTTDEEAVDSPSAGAARSERAIVALSLRHGRMTAATDLVAAWAGQPIVFRIKADAPGELHVHSAEGHQVSFPSGASRHTVTLEQPGTYAVELHQPETVVVRLDVR